MNCPYCKTIFYNPIKYLIHRIQVSPMLHPWW